jgi:hypothetical protein
MNVEIGTEATQFPEFINGIFVAVRQNAAFGWHSWNYYISGIFFSDWSSHAAVTAEDLEAAQLAQL